MLGELQSNVSNAAIPSLIRQAAKNLRPTFVAQNPIVSGQ
jgi:hypothetical protein